MTDWLPSGDYALHIPTQARAIPGLRVLSSLLARREANEEILEDKNIETSPIVTQEIIIFTLGTNEHVNVYKRWNKILKKLQRELIVSFCYQDRSYDFIL